MKTKSFKQIIEHLIDNGVENIKIIRSDCFMGCFEPKDIIALEVSINGHIYFVTVTRVFDNPLIVVDRIIRDENNRLIDRFTISKYNYSK